MSAAGTSQGVTYDSLVGLPELLNLQDTLNGHDAGLLFVVVHQVHELAFKLLLRELERARDGLDADDPAAACRCMRRSTLVARSLLGPLGLLETITLDEYAEMRPHLGAASALHSVQYREMEFVAGLKRPGLIMLTAKDDQAEARLRARMEARSVWDAFRARATRQGLTDLARLFEEPPSRSDLRELALHLLTFDDALREWRRRHLGLARRFAGGQVGTGGTAGARYLRGGLTRRLFPELARARRAAG